MNNPLRRLLQRKVELKVFEKFLIENHITLNESIILDVGCGSGYGTELLDRYFKPKRLIAFDFMPEQIKLAQKRNIHKAEFFVGDVTKIDLASNTVDAVFSFGILHHVPLWRKALSEMARVLKPEGILLIEDINGTLAGIIDNYFGFDHPLEARFTWQEFTEQIERVGFKIKGKSTIIKGVNSYLCVKVKHENQG